MVTLQAKLMLSQNAHRLVDAISVASWIAFRLTLIRYFMKEYRETLSQLAAIGFETLSSEQTQVDWIELKYEVKPNICNRINVFVIVMDLINFYSISNLIKTNKIIHITKNAS